MLPPRRALTLAWPLALSACSAPDARSIAPCPPAFPAPRVDPTITGEGHARRIEDPRAVPLVGPRVDAAAGDFLLENGDRVAVVSRDGRVIDFGERGGRDEVTAIDPVVFFGLDAAHFEPASAEVTSDGHLVHVTRRVLEKPLALHVFVGFSGDRLRIETAATATAPLASPVAVTLGERVGWSNVPTWAAGHGLVKSAGAFRADFVGRDSGGFAYALASEAGPLLARFQAGDLGFFEGASTGEAPEVIASERATTHRIIVVTHARGSVGAAAARLSPTPRPSTPFTGSLPASAFLEIGRCPEPNHATEPLTRFRAGEPLTPPDGCWQARVTAYGHASSAWVPSTSLASLTLPPSGELRFSVTDKATHRPLPARVLVRGTRGTPNPDWGDDADDGAALDVVYSDRGAGARPLPPGSYVVTIGRGLEYSAVDKEITVGAGATVEVAAELERVVDTRGFISADLHLHAMPSPDAIQPLEDRIRALVATGVEVGVATDHNKVTDYSPVIRALGMGAWLASIVGDEVTTREPNWGHFNVFPLPAGSSPVPYRGAVPRAIFDAAHAASRDTLVQLNHPRMESIGYFDLTRFDAADVKGFQRRVPVADLGFDAIEVFNGDHYSSVSQVEECLQDFYALLDAGIRVTATGNSDSHRLTFHEPGVPRNYVALANDDPAAFDEHAFVAAVRAGRVMVTSGPFLRFTANGRGIGDTVPAGDVSFSVQVDAPDWIDVDRVEILAHGKEVVASWDGPFSGSHPRFASQAHAALKAGDWVLAVARGSRPMTYLHRAGATPFAFTNPIWIGP